MTIRLCEARDLETIWEIISDGAQAYKGVLPEDCLREPYMSKEELRHEIAEGVVFWGVLWGSGGSAGLAGVMGIQKVLDVTLIRHAYVRSENQGQGIGTELLKHLRTQARGPVLIGTWAAAVWAIRFYQRNGFRLTEPKDKVRLLTYWTVPERQIETSVVLTDQPV